MLQEINNDVSVHVPWELKQLKTNIGYIHAIHAGFQTSAICCRMVIPHFIKRLVQIVADIPLGIEFVPKVDILKAEHPLILGIASHRQIGLSADHTGCMAMNRTMLDKIAFCRLLNGITSPPIAAFVEENYGSADDGIFGMCVQKCDFLFKASRKGDIVSVHPSHIFTGGNVQTAIQCVIQPHVSFVLKENDFIGKFFLICFGYSIGVIL